MDKGVQVPDTQFKLPLEPSTTPDPSSPASVGLPLSAKDTNPMDSFQSLSGESTPMPSVNSTPVVTPKASINNLSSKFDSFSRS